MSDKPAPTICTHENFVAKVDVHRLSKKELGPITGYTADVTVKCAVCDLPFRFLGVRAGISFKEPSVSADALELRTPLEPAYVPEILGAPVRRERQSMSGAEPREVAKADQPHRIQLSRRKGWRMPENTVKVDRSTKFGNPYQAGEDGDGDRERLVRLFYAHLTSTAPGHAFADQARRELRGKNLACWCPLDGPCHADVLLEIANS